MWFQPVIASPLGPRLLGQGRQPLARHLFATYAYYRPLDEETLTAYLGPLREPARARAGSTVYRALILPEAGRVARGAYRHLYLRVPTRILCGAQDRALPVEVVDRGHQGRADRLDVAVVEHAAHFLLDDRPDAVVDAAVALIERTQTHAADEG